MPFSTAGQMAMLYNLVHTLGGYLSLHSAYGATNTTAFSSELSGGGYARVAVSANWPSSLPAPGNTITTTGSITAFNVPAGGIVAWVGIWDTSTLAAGSATDFQGMGPNGGATQYAFTAPTGSTTFTAPGHTLAVNQTVVLFNGAGATIPTPYVVGNFYQVTAANTGAGTFSIQNWTAAGGGSGGAITTTSAGAGIVQGITVETYSGSGGTFTVTSDTLSLF